MKGNDEEGLIALARLGDSKAFDRLVESSLSKVLGMARGIVRDPDAAWDVAQEAFLRAWKRLDQFRGESSFSTWVCGIAVREALDRVRSGGRETGMEHETLAAVETRRAPDSSNRAVAGDLRGALAAAIGALPEFEREVFLLHEIEELRYREIAARVGIPIGTVMSRLHAARMKLRATMTPYWSEEGR